MLRIAMVGSAAVVLTAGAPAHAAVATVPANKCCVSVNYDASPGEANRVSVAVAKDVTGFWLVTISDPGAHFIQTPPSDDPASRSCVPSGLHRVTCRADILDDVSVDLGDRGDTFAASGLPVALGVSGGDGNDRLNGGPGPTNFVPGLGADIVVGGPGGNLVNYADHPGPVHVSLDGLANDGMAGEGDNVIGVNDVYGSSFDDVLVGSARPDVLDGGGGHDLLDGRGGDDELDANGGDHLIGGAGRDQIRALGGNNEIDAVDGEVDTIDCGFLGGNVLNVDQFDVEQNCPA